MENLNLLERRSFVEWVRLLELIEAIRKGNEEFMSDGFLSGARGSVLEKHFTYLKDECPPLFLNGVFEPRFKFVRNFVRFYPGGPDIEIL